MKLKDQVSIFIPTYNAEGYLKSSLPILGEMIEPSNIVIVDSSSSDNTVAVSEANGVRTYKICKDDFNHGKTRNLAMKYCMTDFVVFMTQDAIPFNAELIEELIAPFKNSQVDVTYARQIPHKNAVFLEKLDRKYKYPEKAICQSLKTLDELGSRTYFLSNSCAAYRMKTFREIGGFSEDNIMGEDTLFAREIISRNKEIRYIPTAKVYHSHNYSFKQLFQRYFDTGVYRAEMMPTIQNKDVKQGSSYIKYILREIITERRFDRLFIFVLNVFVSYLGYFLGLKHSFIPMKLKRNLSMHSGFWK